MYRYFLLIAYDGYDYSGWQSQKNGSSIQEIIEYCITKILQTKITVIGSGRTDAKVHALGQVAHFDIEKKINNDFFLISLNSLLPSEIRILDFGLAPNDFHARFSVYKKIYHYYICTKPIVLPHLRHNHLHIQESYDLALIQKACNQLVGTYDFTSLANSGSNPGSMIKTIYQINCIKTDVGFYLEFIGSGFLYKMVRNIVGLALEVNRNKMALSQIMAILKAKDRRKAPAAAAAHGLFLMKVVYPKQFAHLFPSENTKPILQILELAKQD